MQPYDIYNAVYRLGISQDMRPWLIVESRPGGLYGCFPISGQCYDPQHFELDPQHPDFASTGLTKRCYILDARIYELPASAFKRKRGCLAGQLLADFRKYAGF